MNIFSPKAYVFEYLLINHQEPHKNILSLGSPGSFSVVNGDNQAPL